MRTSNKKAQQVIDLHGRCANASCIIGNICNYAKSINAYLKVYKCKPEKVIWHEMDTYDVLMLNDDICKFVIYDSRRIYNYTRKVHSDLSKQYVMLNDKAYLIMDKRVTQIDIDCITIDLCAVDDRLYSFKLKLLNKVTFPDCNLQSAVGLDSEAAFMKIIRCINIFLQNKFNSHATQLAAVFSLMTKIGGDIR